MPSTGALTDEARAPLPTGAGVLGLRRPPMVGRAHLRDALWRALREVDRGPRVCWLRGPSGVGKSHLAGWIARRAQELGCAQVLTGHHGPLPVPSHGAAAALARHLRTGGLPPDAVEPHLQKRLGETLSAPERSALAERLSPRDPPRAVFRDAAERLGPLRRAVEALARSGRVVLVLDDVQWGLEAIRLAEALGRGAAPVLVLLVTETSAPATRPTEAARLAALDATALDVPALPDGDQLHLLRDELGLSAAFTRRLMDRSEGSPLFALQIVEDQLARGTLIETGDGWGLRDGAHVRLPDSLHGVWRARLSAVVDRLGRGAAEALELAAVMGGSVDMATWARVCTAEALPIDLDRLLAELVDRALATRDPGGQSWRPTHGMLRESLVRTARERGRDRRWHRSLADALAGVRDLDGRERRAHHLLACGARRDALEAVMDVAMGRFEAEGGDAAAPMVAEARALVVALSLPEQDPHHARLAYLEVRSARVDGEYVQARALADPAVARARAAGWPPGSLRLAAEAADLARLQGRLADAWSLLQEVYPHSAAHPDAAGMVAQRLGTVCYSRGEGEQTTRWAEIARAAFLAVGDAVSATTALGLGGAGLLRQGRPADAHEAFRAAAREHRADGCRWGLADTLNNLGYTHQLAGELDAAREAYGRSVLLWESVGGHLHLVPQFNLAILDAEHGDAARARPALERTLADFRALGWAHAWQAQALAALALVHASLGDEDAHADVRAELDRTIAAAEAVGPEVDRLLALADARRRAG